MTVDLEPMPISVLVELINGWAGVARQEDERSRGPYPRIASIAERLGVPDRVRGALTNEELAAVADQLHPVFAVPHAHGRAELVNEYLAATNVRPTLRQVDGTLCRGWSTPDDRSALMSAAAITLREFLVEHGPDRLGVCAGQRCADVYVDASPAGRRRFCSVTCQNRTRLAAFRGRKAAGESGTNDQ